MKILKKLKKQPASKNIKQKKSKETTKSKLILPLRYIVTVILFLIVIGLATPYFYYHQYNYKIGDFCSEKIVSPYDFDVIDEENLTEKQEYALSQEKDLYKFDLTYPDKGVEIVKEILDEAKRLNEEEGEKADIETKAKSLDDMISKEYEIQLSPETLKTIIENANYKKFISTFQSLFENVYIHKGVVRNKRRFITAKSNNMISMRFIGEKHIKLDPLKAEVISYLDELPTYIENTVKNDFFFSESKWNLNMRNAVTEMSKFIAMSLGPNIEFLKDETLKQRAEVKSSVQGDKIIVRKGDVIIDRQLVSHKHKIILDKLNQYLRKAVIHTLFSHILIALGFLLMIVIYLKRYHPLFKFTIRNSFIIALPFIIVLGISRIFLLLNLQDIAGYFFPAGVVGMLFLLLLDVRAAIVMVFIADLIFGMQVFFDYRYMLVAFIGGLTAVYSLYGIRRRWDIILAGISVGFVNMVSIALVNLMNNPTGLLLNYWILGIGLANGFFCSMITISALPIFEFFLGVTTDIRLLELTGVKHPLLEELAEKAPASYQHSLNVAKLAESAADAIGGNYLLIRAGAYFHDVGKAKNSKYFSENQMTQEEKNLHNELTPKQSADIIKRHVLEGIELGEKHRLPQPVMNIISQHHGDGIINYFYDKALKESNGAEVNEEDYRYPCPKPQSPEAGIVLLADAVEAATTSINPKSEEEIRSLVSKLINEKFVDGQLNDCALTLQQLHKIGESFVKQLVSRFHKRIAYPWQQE